MKIKGAIFDLDGTLIDSMGIWHTLGEKYLIWKGLTPAPDLNEQLKAMSLLQAAQYFRKEYHLADSDEAIIRQINTLIENEYRDSILLKDSAEAFLRNLKNSNVKMCIATAIERPLVEAVLIRLNIADCFCGIITCREAGFGKDRPDIYHRALELLQTSSNETVVFEDALHAIKTAKAAGFLVAAVYDKSADADKEEIRSAADWYLNSFDEWEMDES